MKTHSLILSLLMLFGLDSPVLSEGIQDLIDSDKKSMAKVTPEKGDTKEIKHLRSLLEISLDTRVYLLKALWFEEKRAIARDAPPGMLTRVLSDEAYKTSNKDIRKYESQLDKALAKKV